MNKKPNILFIFSDQQRWDTLGCYGQPLEVTPNLDRLAAEGVRFDQAYTCQPVCGPARACLQTGRYATEVGVYRNNLPLRPEDKSMAQYLSEAGYEVGYLGKWHLASFLHGPSFEPRRGDEKIYHHEPVPPERRGGYKDFWLAADVLEFTSHGYDGYLFDQNMNRVDFEGYRVDCMTDFALDYLRSRDGEKPFFLFLSFLEPHHQNDHERYEGPHGSKERFKDFKPPADLVGLEGDWAEQYPDYLGCCASLDENVGRLQKELERLGLWENTLLIYSSDHGSHFRTRNKTPDPGNWDDYKRACHDACIHLPMIIHGPGFEGGRVIPDLVSLIDLMPTVLTAGGVEIPELVQGRPLQELLSGTPADWRQEVFLQISESQVGRAIRTDRWKYSVRAPGLEGVHVDSSDSYVEDFLYDLNKDPIEHHNLVSDPSLADVRRELAERLKQRMTEAGEPISKILPNPGP